MSSDAPQELPTTPAATSAAALELRIAGRAGPTFVLDASRENMLGRAQDAAIVLADRLASRAHAAVRCEAGRWVLRDLGSRNGTWVDGAQITSHTLTDGAVIRIGTAELAFRHVRPPAAAPGGKVLKCGPVSQLEGSVLRRSSIGSTDDARRPLLLYQASIRLLASRSVRDVIGTALELAVEHCGAASVGWFTVHGESSFEPVCVAPPGSPLARLLGESTCRLVAHDGNAVWVAAAETAAGEPDTALEIACVPIVENNAVHAAIAASAPKGAVRSADFDFLVALASLAAAACAGHAQPAAPPTESGGHPSDLSSLQTVDLDASEDTDGLPDDVVADRTIALDSISLQQFDPAGGDASPATARIGSFVAETATLKLGDWQRALVIEALRRTGGSVPNAAAELGISRATLCRKLESYGLTKSR